MATVAFGLGPCAEGLSSAPKAGCTFVDLFALSTWPGGRPSNMHPSILRAQEKASNSSGCMKLLNPKVDRNMALGTF